MKTSPDRSPENRNNSVPQILSGHDTKTQALQVNDSRPETAIHNRLKSVITNSAQVRQLAAVKNAISTSATIPPAQDNNTGLPDNLKSGIENLSGIDISDVKVHYNSEEPSQLQAHAYAQGTDIHVAPGQEQHLPHEAWHVVQQKQGRVKPTLQLKSGVYVNDDMGLEHEADVMGERSAGLPAGNEFSPILLKQLADVDGVAQRALSKDVLNVAGEAHTRAQEKRRQVEAEFSSNEAGGDYWTEMDFKVDEKGDLPADSFLLRLEFELAAVKAEIGIILTKKEPPIEYLQDLENSLEQIDWLKDSVKEDSALKEDRAFVIRYKQFRPVLEPLSEILKGTDDEDKQERFEDIKNLGVQFLRFAYAITIKSLAEASTNRGIAMHRAAQAKFQEKGLWKIGNEHVGQIKKYAVDNKEDIKYNLMTMEEFDAEYEAYTPPPPPL